MDKALSPPGKFLQYIMITYSRFSTHSLDSSLYNDSYLKPRFIIEQKTSSLGEYEKQLANGRCFCDRLFSLYKEHGYCPDDPIYIGLLIWQPRTLPSKGETSHKSEPTSGTHHRFKYFFEEKNNRSINLQGFIKRL